MTITKSETDEMVGHAFAAEVGSDASGIDITLGETGPSTFLDTSKAWAHVGTDRHITFMTASGGQVVPFAVAAVGTGPRTVLLTRVGSSELMMALRDKVVENGRGEVMANVRWPDTRSSVISDMSSDDIDEYCEVALKSTAEAATVVALIFSMLKLS